MEPFAEASPRFKARLAGVLLLLSVLMAICNEFFVRGRLGSGVNLAADLVEVSGMVAVTVLLYYVFKPVNRSLALLAASFNLAGGTFEALRLTPRGVDIGIVLHGFYCILIGYLIFRSTLLPRILGALMAFAGLGWLTFLVPSLANDLTPYNLASGLLGEASMCLGLLVIGVNVRRSEAKEPRCRPEASETQRPLICDQD
jgi:hypothetical protein